MSRAARARARSRGALRCAAELLLAATASLWTLDVLSTLAPHARSLGDDTLVGAPSLLGLLLVDTQIAGLAAAGATLLAFVSGRRGRAAHRDAVDLCAAALCGVAVRVDAELRWAFAVALLVWIALRAAGQPLPRDGARAPATLPRLLWPLLAVAGLARAVVDANAGDASAALLPGLLGTAAAVVAVALRGAAALPLRAVAWLPLATALGLAAFAAIASLPRPPAPPTAPEPGDPQRPPVVLIVLDTVRADHLRSYGYARDTMPSLERFARGATLVTRAISNAGWTSPAHASLLSGRTVSGHGVHNPLYARDGEAPWTRPFEDVAWLPEVLARRGYTSYAVTANELALPEGIRGFARVVRPHRVDWRRSVAGSFDPRLPWSLPLSERLRWRMPYVDGARVVELVERTVPPRGGPLFLLVNLMDAHSPYHPPPAALAQLGVPDTRLFGRYTTPYELSLRWPELPAGKRAHLRDLYDGGLAWLDRHLGRLLAWIDARFGEEAVVIVTSDHGEMLGEGGHVGHDLGLPQSILHVPLVIRSPGLAPGRLDATLSLRRLYDFVLRVAAGERPGATELLRGSEAGIVSERHPRSAAGRTTRAWVSLIDGEHKAIGPSQYGLQAVVLDPGGRAAGPADAAVAHRLSRRIDDYWASRRRAGEAPASRLRPDQRERLRALGYLD